MDYKKIIDDIFEAPKTAELTKGLKRRVDKTKLVKQKQVSKALKATSKKKYKVPPLAPNNAFENLFRKILFHMLNPKTKQKILLTGEPGTGKTRTIETIAGLLNLPLLVIEAAHATEEHLIQIPYVVYKAGKKKVNNIVLKTDDEGETYEVVEAESLLIEDLKSLLTITPNQYRVFLEKNKRFLPILEKYQKTIKRVREMYRNILLIDEYFRAPDKKTMNIFRTILNGKIGNEPIPRGTYIIFASNIRNEDGSMMDVPENQEFIDEDFDENLDKNDFMRYLADKYTDETLDNESEEESDKKADNIVQSILGEKADVKISKKDKEVKNPIKPEVYNAFAEAITKEEFGEFDEETGIRVSPRRWEEIIKYVNFNLPPKSKQEARALLTNLRNQFYDYRTKTVNEKLYKKYANLVLKLMKETGGDDFGLNYNSYNRPKDWMETLGQQIETKLKLGKDRKYTPVLSGLPGVGKTSVIRKLAKKLGLKLIEIDCTTLNYDDVVGLFIGEKGQNDEIKTKTTKPPLYKHIINEYDPNWPKNGEYSHILFFDEISRINKKVANSIRKIMLDKVVNEKYKLPDDIMIISAMNPSGEGTEQLPDHFVDTIDVIDVEMDFFDLIDYIRHREDNKKLEEESGLYGATDFFADNMIEIARTLSSDFDEEGNPIEDDNKKLYYWDIKKNSIYISPRVIDNMINEGINQIAQTLKDIYNFDPAKEYTDEELNIIAEDLKSIYVRNMADFIKGTSGFIKTFNGNLKRKELYDILQPYVSTKSIIELMITAKTRVANIVEMANNIDYNFSKIYNDEMNRDIFVTTIVDAFKNINPTKVIDDIIYVFNQMISMYLDVNNKQSYPIFFEQFNSFIKLISDKTISELTASNELYIRLNGIIKADIIEKLQLKSKETIKQSNDTEDVVDSVIKEILDDLQDVLNDPEVNKYVKGLDKTIENIVKDIFNDLDTDGLMLIKSSEKNKTEAVDIFSKLEEMKTAKYNIFENIDEVVNTFTTMIKEFA